MGAACGGSLSARLRRCVADAEVNACKTIRALEDDEFIPPEPSSQQALEALDQCIAEEEAELLQRFASLAHAREVSKELRHGIASLRFEANVRDLLASSVWAERKARRSAENEARIVAAEHEAAALIQEF